MKLNDIKNVLEHVNEDTSIMVNQGNTTYVVTMQWQPVIETQDKTLHYLKKDNWTAQDLVQFIADYSSENENSCLVMLFYDDDTESITLVLKSFQLMNDFNYNTLVFYAIEH